MLMLRQYDGDKTIVLLPDGRHFVIHVIEQRKCFKLGFEMPDDVRVIRGKMLEKALAEQQADPVGCG